MGTIKSETSYNRAHARVRYHAFHVLLYGFEYRTWSCLYLSARVERYFSHMLPRGERCEKNQQSPKKSVSPLFVYCIKISFAFCGGFAPFEFCGGDNERKSLAPRGLREETMDSLTPPPSAQGCFWYGLNKEQMCYIPYRLQRGVATTTVGAPTPRLRRASTRAASAARWGRGGPSTSPP